MKKQMTFADIEYSNRKRRTRREEFLTLMDKIIPWKKFIELIQPVYFIGERGRPPIGIEPMLRMYFLQIWFTLSDESVEDSIYDSYAMRTFMGINFFESQAPDATTLLKFRKLLVDNDIQIQLLYMVAELLEENGLLMRGGSVVDATIISAPTSTKNSTGKRDSEMHSTKKGGQYYFGAKAHISVDAGAGYVRDVETTAANVDDRDVVHDIIRHDDEVVYGDAGYIGVEKREAIKDDPALSQIDFRINEKRSKVQKTKNGQQEAFAKHIEQRKSAVRSKVEYVFHVVKNIFGFHKTPYKGLVKLHARLCALFLSANLYMCARAGKLIS
jgi:IS5 family transposase